MRRGWLGLGVVVVLTAAAACGDPTITDLDPSGTNPTSTTGTPVPTNSDGTTPTPTPTVTSSPGANPTLPPGVPPFAAWDAQVRAAGCAQCHSGGSGGYTMDPNIEVQYRKYYWFQALCDRNFNANGAGVQVYTPTAVGRLKNIYCNSQAHAGGAVPAGRCATVQNWLQSADAGTTPPSCFGSFDLANSN